MNDFLISSSGKKYTLHDRIYFNENGGTECFAASGDSFPNRKLFLKRINYRKNKTANLREMVINEIRTTLNVHKVNNFTSEILDYWEDKKAGVFFIVMEKINAITLTQWMKENAAISLTLNDVSFRSKILVEICRILRDISSKYPIYVHKDIKPDNIMITEKGGSPIVYIVDFGIMHSDRIRGLGTAAYCAPEQGTDSVNVRVTCKTDIFAVGMIGFELLTGTLPVIGSSFSKNADDRDWAQTPQLDPASVPRAKELNNILIEMTRYRSEDRIGYNDIISELNLIAKGKNR